jgi:hypothetical protein
MIRRVRHGWTDPANADAYERLSRHDAGAEVEFATPMRFETWDDVQAFAGPDHERAGVIASRRRRLAA